MNLSTRQLILAGLLIVAGFGQFAALDGNYKMMLGVAAAFVGLVAVFMPPSVRSAKVGEIVDPIRSAVRRITDGKRPEAPVGTSPQLGAVFDDLVEIHELLSDRDEREGERQGEVEDSAKNVTSSLRTLTEGVATQLNASEETARY